LALLPLLAASCVLAEADALAFNFGRHRQTNTDSGSQQEAKQEPSEAAAGPSPVSPVSPPAPTTEGPPPTKGAPKAADPGVKAPSAPAKNPKLIERTDFSGQFTFVLPEGWRTYQIPYQPHDVLSLREKDSIQATISFADELAKTNLEKLQQSTVDKAKNELKKYELVESQIVSLPGGQPCARIISLEQIDEIDTRQVQYIVALKKKHFLVVTLTTAKPIGDKYDKLLQDVVASISTVQASAKTTK